MAEQEGGAEDRSEAATPRRIEKAREQGNVAVSQEVASFAALLAATLIGMLALPPLGLHLARTLGALLETAGTAGLPAAIELLRVTGLGLLPLLGAVTLAGVLAHVAQTGPLLRPEAVAPDPSRVSPLAGLKRMFGVEGLLALGRAVLKVCVVGAALWASIDPDRLLASLQMPAGRLLGEIGSQGLRLLLVSLAALGVLAAADLLLVRWRWQRQLRMSRQDLKEELRDSEGDPLVKARLRRIREVRARRRMMAAVPQATVVITNPTHYAVALEYAPGQVSAPKLVAKGADAVAHRIRAIAEEHGVPIVSNPPLARALFRLEPDTEIPMEHWQAVAEIIAYVWRLGGQRLAPGTGPETGLG